MSFNGNDIQFLSIPDRVKRLEASTLKKVLGKYFTNPVALTTVVENLELEVDELEYVEKIEWDDDTFKFTITYRDGTTQVIDLPLEQMIVDVTYDNTTKDLTFELNNGNTLVVPLDDIIDGLVKTSDIVDNLTTDDATKVLSAKQGKVLQDGKLDKSSSTIGLVVYTRNNTTDGVRGLTPIPYANQVPLFKSNALLSILSGNKASRPTTSLNNGDQYFNTDTNQLEVYIGDANHWLNQVYKSGDTLPTPAVGRSHTYMVIGNPLGGNTYPTWLEIDGNRVFGMADTSKSGPIIYIFNDGNDIYVTNSEGGQETATDLIITDGDGVALKRVG